MPPGEPLPRTRIPRRIAQLLLGVDHGSQVAAETASAEQATISAAGRCMLDLQNPASYISSISSLSAIIEEAWEHRRRRHRTLGVAALATGATAAIVIAAVGPGSPSGSSGPARPAVVAASTVLSRPPDIGVRCPVANSIACDRVGLAVWLKHPALSVTATIAGAPLALNHRDEFLWPGDPPRTSFAGYLQPAGIVSRLHVRPVEGNVVNRRHDHDRVTVRRHMWFGEGNTPPAAVRLTIHDPGGRTVVTHVKVELSPGWG